MGLATRLLSDPDMAEDCAQETIVGAWRRRDQLRDAAALPAWLRRSLVNRIIDRSRRSHDELDIDAIEADWKDDAYSVQPELVLERAELRDELEDALARLPVIYRLPVVLHDALGWTAVEIAQSMDVGLPAAKQRLRRGRMMLVSALASSDGRREASLAQPMRCWQARRHVSAYLDGELDEATKSMVEGHLAGCPTCPPLYTSLVGDPRHDGRTAGHRRGRRGCHRPPHPRAPDPGVGADRADPPIGSLQGRGSLLTSVPLVMRPRPTQPSGRRQLEPDARPALRPVLGADSAAMSLHEGADDREAEAARSGASIPRWVGLIQAIEDPRQILGGNPCAGVLDRDANHRPVRRPTISTTPPPGVCRSALSVRAARTCARRPASASTAQSGPTSADSSMPAGSRPGLEGIHRGLRHFGYLHPLALERQLPSLGHVDGPEVVDDPAEHLRLLADRPQIARLRREYPLLDGPGRAVDHRQRRAKLVDRVLDEPPALLVGALEVRRHRVEGAANLAELVGPPAKARTAVPDRRRQLAREARASWVSGRAIRPAATKPTSEAASAAASAASDERHGRCPAASAAACTPACGPGPAPLPRPWPGTRPTGARAWPGRVRLQLGETPTHDRRRHDRRPPRPSRVRPPRTRGRS